MILPRLVSDHGPLAPWWILSRTVEPLLYVVAGVIGGTGVWLIVDGYRTERRRRAGPIWLNDCSPTSRGSPTKPRRG